MQVVWLWKGPVQPLPQCKDSLTDKLHEGKNSSDAAGLPWGPTTADTLVKKKVARSCMPLKLACDEPAEQGTTESCVNTRAGRLNPCKWCTQRNAHRVKHHQLLIASPLIQHTPNRL